MLSLDVSIATVWDAVVCDDGEMMEHLGVVHSEGHFAADNLREMVGASINIDMVCMVCAP